MSEAQADRFCRKCGSPRNAQDNFCRNCGSNFKGTVAWYYRPPWIIALALFVLGPLVLPLVWKSPLMTRQVKIVLSIGITIYTLLLFYYTYVFVALFYQNMQQIMNLNL